MRKTQAACRNSKRQHPQFAWKLSRAELQATLCPRASGQQVAHTLEELRPAFNELGGIEQCRADGADRDGRQKREDHKFSLQLALSRSLEDTAREGFLFWG